MSTPYRRYEILLPLRFNDGKAAPDNLLAEVFLELRKQFGAVSAESQTIHGQWKQHGEIYRDELMRVFVDVADTLETRRFFLQYKEHLKQRFEQLDIWVTSHPIDVL